MLSPVRSNRLHTLRAAFRRSELPSEYADALLSLAELVFELDQERATQIETLGALSADHRVLLNELRAVRTALGHSR